jgi:hypothetical protein
MFARDLGWSVFQCVAVPLVAQKSEMAAQKSEMAVRADRVSDVNIRLTRFRKSQAVN